MTDIPKEDRDLIERLLTAPVMDAITKGQGVVFYPENLLQIIQAARSEGPARAPVVDEKDALRRAALYLLGGGALRGSFGFRTDDGSEIELTAKNKTLLAALGASQ